MTKAKAEQEQRQTAAEDFRTCLTSGRASMTDVDALTAEWLSTTAAAEVAALLVQGCEAGVQRAERALINDDTAVADVLADVLRKLYAGRLPVQVVTLATDVKPNDNGDPVLFILQEKAGKNTGGILSGKLMIILFRPPPPLFAELDGQMIESACREWGYAMEVGMWSSIDHGDYCQDPASVTVQRAWLPVPVLTREPEDADFRAFEGETRNTLRNAVTGQGRTPRLYESGEEMEGRAWAKSVSHKVLSKTQDKRVRRMVIEVVTNVWPDVQIASAPGMLLREAVAGKGGTYDRGRGTGRLCRALQGGRPRLPGALRGHQAVRRHRALRSDVPAQLTGRLAR
ncbi:hypothetical protein GCM10023328_02110 [Modestobacter marinus]|uniref:Uncharacterized protein n=1 Tax=Modestobacter marinus TaxID=477641 RepID=A0A846LJ91_9ACTN|nr:hypothetical protein [Modestobacter marinus]NIH67361.1 hypothetical protein [Modestobacter marinus]GGL54243.1 hypothetical protein GCM10011589_07850 [Modestobacter marinus]